MIREEVERLLPEISHWAKGGVLYWYNSDNKTWKIVEGWSLDWYIDVPVVIEDEYFEARKAFALDEEIEVYSDSTGFWVDCNKPLWDLNREYRPKPKEPLYEWQWVYIRHGICTFGITEHRTIDEAIEGHQKFEPSKRIRK